MFPQSIFPSELLTVPVPLPDLLIERVLTAVSKFAVTFVATVRVRVQVVLVPLQPPPLQPVKVERELGVAVRVTAVFSMKLKLHTAPQSMPVGELVILPVPVPVLIADNRKAFNPAWVIVTVWPPMVMVPVLVLVVVLAVYE